MVLEVIEQLIKNFQEADMVVIGIGEELNESVFTDENERLEILHFFWKYLEHKNHFLITSNEQDLFLKSEYNFKRICMPFVEGQEDEAGEKQWDLYNKWLFASVSKKLLILELGEGFEQPNVFRWPFEKIAYLGQKTQMVRVHKNFYQLPDNLESKATSVPMDAKGFLLELKKYLEKSVESVQE